MQRRLWRTKDEYITLLHVVLRTCTVAVKDLRDVEHSLEVTAETLYEAIATALAALQQDNWVGEIGQGFLTGFAPAICATMNNGMGEGIIG